MNLLPTQTVEIGGRVTIGGGRRFALIAGPCVIESEAMTLETADRLKEICQRQGVELIFKSSFDKANRSSASSPRGVGMDEGLRILARVGRELQLPVVTDVHEAWQCDPVAQVADLLQIPAFLSRQTDLLLAAARTGKPVNVKKGQFMAPWDMKHVVDKLRRGGCPNVLLCERGVSFGYNNLVVDMTALVDMRRTGCPVVFDATHSVQQPGAQDGSSGGRREMVPHLLRAAVAVGVDAIFAEVHPDPDRAFSDGPNQLHLDTVEDIIAEAVAIDTVIKNHPSSRITPCEQPSHRPAHARHTHCIRLLLTDVDGVMTDAGMYYAESGEELKKFNAHDGMGLQLLRQHGVKTGIITSESSETVVRRARRLQVDFLVQGARHEGKLDAIRRICRQEGIALQEVAYVGDDVNCLEALQAVGLPACPHDATTAIRALPGILRLTAKGGEGCVRELAERIIERHLPDTKHLPHNAH